MTTKQIHTVVLDAGPIIRGEPSVSSLLQQSDELVSTHAVISEIKDESARSRLQTSLLPFLTLKDPNPKSIKLISDFARKTGDFAVLSRTDIEILALAYELECERNGGDWRLRSTPGQRRTNGPPPQKAENSSFSDVSGNVNTDTGILDDTNTSREAADSALVAPTDNAIQKFTTDEDLSSASNESRVSHVTSQLEYSPHQDDHDNIANESTEDVAQQIADVNLTDPNEPNQTSAESDSEGWITPNNIKKHQAKEASKESASVTPEPKTMQVATITTDFAMQNVLLQMNLNLISPSLQRVRHIKTFVLRCHACFNITKDMSKQFCPKCGQPTLTRVSCSTDQQTGEFKLHLKKNMQWNNRGNVYSIPKPVSGSASGKAKGGGKDGWGQRLILAEDQKEYVKAIKEEKKMKSRDLMDEDYLPSILSGDRGKASGRPKIGAGRDVNSRKR